MASFGTAYIDVAGDFAPLEAQIAKMSAGPVGKKMESLGKSLTKSLTLPIVGVSAAAGKFSMDFQRSMTLISTQAGGTKKEVKGLSAEILKMSQKGRFAQGPNELAEALFNLESVGLRGSKAMKALKASSDLATVGNANLESTTSALAGVLKTGIKGASNMHEAIGTLNATIGAGKMHMEDLNSAIGTGFLGKAAGLGVSLSGVGAALAELTSQGTPANSAATRLRMTMSLMAAPTEKAKSALSSIGIGSEDLAKKMRASGSLIPALEELQEHLHGLSKTQESALISEAFGGSRSGGTIEQLLNSLTDTTEKQEQVIENSHKIGEAIKETNADPEVKLQKAWSAIQATLIQLGDVILPLVVPAVQKLAEHIAEAGEKFAELSPHSKKLVVEVAAAVAALGPLLSFGGKLLGMYDKVANAVGRVITGIASLATAEEASAVGSGGRLTGTSVSSVKGRLNAGEQLLPAAGAEGLAATIAKPSTLEIPAAPGVAESGSGALAGALAAAPEAAPWVALGVAVAASGAGMVALYQNSKRFREVVAPMGHALGHAFDEINGRIEAIGRAFTGLGNALKGHQGIIGAAKEMYGAVKGPVDAIAGILGGKLLTSFQNVSSDIGQMLRGIGHSFAGFGQVVQGAIEVITGILTLRFTKFFQGIKDIFSGGFKTLVGVVTAATTPFSDAAKGTGLALQTAFGGVWSKIEGVFENGVNAVIGLLNDMIGLIDKLPFVNIGKIGTLNAAANIEGEGRKGNTSKALGHVHRQGGGIVPGHGDGDTFSTLVPADTFILNKKATPAFGYQTGGHVPVMLEPGERVFYPPEVERVGLGNLRAMNAAVPRFSVGGFAESLGSDVTSLPGKILGAARSVAGSGLGAILDSLPNPSSVVPSWLAGFGGYLKSQLVDWVKGKQKQQAKNRPSLFLGKLPAGVGSFDGMPVDKWIIPILSWAKKQGWDGDITSGYRSEAEQAALYANRGSNPNPVAPPGSSNHERTAYPGGAIDTSDYSTLAALMRRYPKRPKLVWGPEGGNPDDVHFSATGMRLGGLVQKFANGGFAKGDYTVKGVAASAEQMRVAEEIMKANDATSAGHLARVAIMMAATQENDVTARNTFELTGAFNGVTPGSSTYDQAVEWQTKGYYDGPNLGAGGGIAKSKKSNDPGLIAQEVEGSAYPTLYEQWKSEGQKWTDGWGGSGSTSSGTKPPTPKQITGKYTVKEPGFVLGGIKDVTKKYKVVTSSLSFPSVSSMKIHECRRELRELRAKLPEYKAAIHDTKDPKTKHALEANLQAIRHRIGALVRQIQRLLAKERREKLVTKIEGRGAMPGIEELIATAERRYNESSEYAEQIVGLEPEEPPNYAGDFGKSVIQPYIEGSESPAWATVLQREAGWRNTILGGEEAAAMRLRGLEAHVERIEALRKTNPSAYNKQKFRLAPLRKAIEGVKALYTPPTAVATGKGANKVSALANLAAGRYTGGTGQFEEALTNVQGIGHSRLNLPTLPSTPVAGTFGGLIWDTQMQIRELGLKIQQAGESGSSGEGEANSARTAALEELLRQANQRSLVETGLGSVLKQFEATYPMVMEMPPYAGKAHSGVIVPGPRTQEKTMVVKGGEGIFTEGQMAAMGTGTGGGDVHVVVNGHINQEPGDTRDPIEVYRKNPRFHRLVREVVGTTQRGVVTSGAGRAFRP